MNEQELGLNSVYQTVYPCVSMSNLFICSKIRFIYKMGGKYIFYNAVKEYTQTYMHTNIHEYVDKYLMLSIYTLMCTHPCTHTHIYTHILIQSLMTSIIRMKAQLGTSELQLETQHRSPRANPGFHILGRMTASITQCWDPSG